MLAIMRAHANDFVFVVGLAMLYWSLRLWSPALAGAVLGVVLMAVALWPLLISMRNRP